MTSSSNPRCLITGCELVLYGQTVHGDLHDLGDVFIFNACTDARGEPAWQDIHGRVDGQYVAHLDEKSSYFTRRGLFVILKETCTLNSAAANYIHRQD